MRFFFKLIGGSLLLFLFVGIYLFTLGTTDLRNEIAKNNPQPEKAKALLGEMAEAHGIANWDSLETYRVEIQDHFSGLIGILGNPYKEDIIHLMLNYIPNTFTGSLDFLSGKDMGKKWGLQSGNSYDYSVKKGLRFRDDNDIYFWLPTYQYFLEFPMRIQQADALAYTGEQTIENSLCDGVLASWKTVKPKRNIDQYLVWIDRSTKQIRKLEYTIRDQYNFLKGAVFYKNYQNFNGILLPTYIPVKSNLMKDGWLHEIHILDFEPGFLTIDELTPDKSLGMNGEEESINQ